MKIYEYAALYVPEDPKKAREDRKEPQLVVSPTVVLARDEKHATMIATRSIPASWDDVIDQVQVAVRPF